MAFQSIHTLYGLQRVAQAEATGVPINLTHMAVGDGNGNPTAPSGSQTQLVRERFRAPVNRVYQSPTEPGRFTAELVIPASEGGFVLREVGVFDDAGSLFVVGNLPDTYKPAASEGAYADTVVRVEFVVSNASVVTLQVDPNVAVATQQWISNTITVCYLLPGGTTGQVLKKKSNTCGDVEWGDPGTANVVVDVIDELQTLADAQTTVTWATVTTRGLAVYIDGVRINQGVGTGEWQPDAANPDTTIVLGKSYPAGTKILGTQNEPAGSVPFPLVRDQNLADVPDKAAARGNLDVYNKAESDASGQPGDIKYTASSTAPTGWLKANGAAVSRTAYAALFAAIGTTFGAGDGFTTFNLPDLRGEFIRGWDDGRGIDAGRSIGSAQAGAIQSHGHSASSADAGSHVHSGSAQSGGTHSHSASSGQAGRHGHTAWTDTQGAHTHSVKEGRVGPGGTEPETLASGDDYTNTTAYLSTTSISGAHGHNVGVGDAPDHSHSVSINSGGEHTHNLSISSAGSHNHSVTVGSTGSAETRPRNVALLACIKY